MKKTPRSKIEINNISDIPGSVNVAGGNIKTQQNISIHYDSSTEIVGKSLALALEKTQKRPKTSRARKTEIEQEVKAIESQIGKKKADKSFLEQRFMNLAKMAPDILEVFVTSLGSPAAGLALTMKKIAKKAKAEAEKVATSQSSRVLPKSPTKVSSKKPRQ